MQPMAAMRLLTVLLLLSGPVISSAARSLQQQDALSNSNGCLDSIPKCEPGACVVRNVMGTATWACLRCMANYAPVVDASGQDNIVQCVCPRGFYEPDSTSTSCSRCSLNSYCPGGDKTATAESPTSRGQQISCGPYLITRNTGARTQADCVAPKGYAMTSPTVATPCGVSEYAPQYNRLGKCLRCQSGLQEDPSLNLTAGQRESKRVVCKVPPGRYMSQGLVRICPQGYYRENFLNFDAALAQVCVPCNPGITTSGAGAGLASQCDRVLPGYGISRLTNLTDAASLPALPQTGATGLPNATLCALGFYSAGGYCVSCPGGTVTTRLGAQAVEECVVPPGYFLPTGSSSMVKCDTGAFRDGWLMFSDPRAVSCTPCGTGIASEARELDANPLATPGSYVRATSASCFIEAGQGMIADGRNTFTARDCPANSYGAAGRVYGLMAAPCKPCPRNMITDGLTKLNSSDACVNPDGFGYASEGASRCAAGFYSAKGSRKPCQVCAPGRTTADDPTGLAQRVVTDCYVKPGFGVADHLRNAGNAFDINVTALTPEQLVSLPVLECPLGTYGQGGTLGAKCLTCPSGSTTEATGSTSVSDCSICIAGFGRAPTSNATACTLCGIGFYQPGGMVSCQACPSATYYPPVSAGNGATWTSIGITTFQGATGVESCVTTESQLSPEAGQAYFSNNPAVLALLNVTTATSLDVCIKSCPGTGCCMAQFESGNRTCKKAVLVPTGADSAGYKLLYKLPPSTMTAASSVPDPVTADNQQQVKAKTLSSGIYARMAIPNDKLSSWLLVGTNLDTEARTFSTAPQSTLWRTGTERECRSLCDNSNVCWGFIFDGASKCLFRGAIDALRTQSFLVLPFAMDLSPYNWQGATALETAIGATFALAARQGVNVMRDAVVAALDATYNAQTGAYDPAAALVRIAGQQGPVPQPGQDPLQAAIDVVISMGAQKGVNITRPQAQAALNATATPTAGGLLWNPTAALAWILQQQQPAPLPIPSPSPSPSPSPPPAELPVPCLYDSLPTAVAALQAGVAPLPDITLEDPMKRLMVPTWVTAVAAILPVSPDQPKCYDVDAALKLLLKAHTAAPGVQDLIKKDKLDGVTKQNIMDAWLAEYAEFIQTRKEFDAKDVYQRISQQAQAARSAHDMALKRGVLVTYQQVMDAVNITYQGSASGTGNDTAAPWLQDPFWPFAAKVASTSAQAAYLTRDQLHTVLMTVQLDSWKLDMELALKRVAMLVNAAEDLKSKATGVSQRQVVDLLLLAFSYKREYSTEWALSKLPSEGKVLGLQDTSKKITGEHGATASEAVDHMLFAYGQVGSFDTVVAIHQLDLLKNFAADVYKKVKQSEFTAAQVRAGAIQAYGRPGYDWGQTDDCLDYMRLAKL